MCMYGYMYTYVCMYTCMHGFIYEYVSTYICIHVYVRIHVCIRVYIYMYACVCTNTHAGAAELVWQIRQVPDQISNHNSKSLFMSLECICIGTS